MVWLAWYMQVFVTLDGTFKTHLQHRSPQVPLTRAMRNTWMPDLTRRRWRKPSTVSCSSWTNKKEGLQGPGQPVVSVAQAAKPGSVGSMSVANAIEAGFLPERDEAHGNMFTPSELRLYQHAQDHRLTRDIP